MESTAFYNNSISKPQINRIKSYPLTQSDNFRVEQIHLTKPPERKAETPINYGYIVGELKSLLNLPLVAAEQAFVKQSLCAVLAFKDDDKDSHYAQFSAICVDTVRLCAKYKRY